MGRQPRELERLFEGGQANVALAVQERHTSATGLRLCRQLTAVCADAFADGRIDQHEQRGIFGGLVLLRDSVRRQAEMDARDEEIGQIMLDNLCRLTDRRKAQAAS